MDRFAIFVVAWATVGVMTLLYLITGFAKDLVVRRNDATRQRVLSVLEVVLFGTHNEAGAVFHQVLALPTRPLLDVVQSLAVDLDGQANERLRTLVRSTGLEKHIIKKASSKRWRVRVQAAQLHHLITHPDFDRSGLLTDPSPLVRARAAEAMAATEAADHVTLMLTLLSDRSPAVRLSAQHSLLQAGPLAVPGLLEHLDGDQHPMVMQALGVAAHLPDLRLVDSVIGLARSHDEQIRAMAANVLGNGTGTMAVGLLEQMLQDPVAEVRVNAIEALARLGVMTAVTRIGRCLADQSFNVRRAAGQALDDLRPAGHLSLRRHLEDPDQFARDMARQVLDGAAARSGLDITTPAHDPLEGLDEPDPYAAIGFWL